MLAMFSVLMAIIMKLKVKNIKNKSTENGNLNNERVEK